MYSGLQGFGYQSYGYNQPQPTYREQPGANIFQQGKYNFNLAIGTPGRDTITQTGTGGAFFALGLGGSDKFSIDGQDNAASLRGTSGNDVFNVGGTNGFYKVNGGSGFDTLNLQGGKKDWTLQNGNIYYNAKTNTKVFAYGIEKIVYNG